MYRRRALADSGTVFAIAAGGSVQNIDAIQDEADGNDRNQRRESSTAEEER